MIEIIRDEVCIDKDDVKSDTNEPWKSHEPVYNSLCFLNVWIIEKLLRTLFPGTHVWNELAQIQDARGFKNAK